MAHGAYVTLAIDLCCALVSCVSSSGAASSQSSYATAVDKCLKACVLCDSTNMAIQDAVCLGKAISDHAHDLTAALSAYDAERVPTTTQEVSQSSVLHASLPAGPLCKQHGMRYILHPCCPAAG